MMDQDQEYNKMIEQLKALPKIEDRQSKTLLYEKINETIHGVKVADKHNFFKWFIPSIATIAFAALILIMIQTGVFKQDQIANQATELQNNMRDIDSQEIREKSTLEINESQESSDENMEHSTNDAKAIDEEQDQETNQANQLVYYNDQYDLPIYNIAVMDQEAMYAIPISLIDTSATDDGHPNDAYNRISSFIDEESFGVSLFPFEEVEFEFSDDYRTINMNVADDYQFPQGSTLANIFQDMINFMFADYPAEGLNLQTESTDYIELGSFGKLSVLEIEPINHLAYKIYQFEDKERLLVPIKQNLDGEQFFTIDEALREMQYDQSEFSIYGVIPSGVEFSVDPSDQDVLRINFEANSLFGDNRMTKEMIEAILMTAKSFDFDRVNIGLEDDLLQVGSFDLELPIPVPDAVNPVLLH